MPSVSELARMVHPRDGHPKVLAMIDAYFDESGIHDDAEVCVVGGYFGGRGQWRRFEKLWSRVLRDFRLRAFHGKEIVKRRDSHGLQWALAQAIAQSKIYPIVNAVPVCEFFKLSLMERRFMTGATLTPDGQLKESGNPNRPYFAPFQQTIRRVLSYAPVGGKAHFFFGLDSKFGEYAVDLYRKLQETGVHDYQDRFGTISFPRAEDTPALQAADLLVHLIYLDMLKRVRENTLYTLPRSPDLIRLLLNNRKIKDDVSYQDVHLMRATMRQLPIEQHAYLLKEDLTC